MPYDKMLKNTKELNIDSVYQFSLMLDTNVKRVNISKKDIEMFRDLLHKSVELTGIDSKQTIQISSFMNQLINLQIKQNNKSL